LLLLLLPPWLLLLLLLLPPPSLLLLPYCVSNAWQGSRTSKISSKEGLSAGSKAKQA
jgi:hypothetical protein